MSSTFTVTTSFPLIVFLRPQPSLNIHSQCCRAASNTRDDAVIFFFFSLSSFFGEDWPSAASSFPFLVIPDQ